MNLDIVTIIWTDPASADAWDDIDQHAKLTASTIISTGFLLHDDDLNMVIALSIDEEAAQASQSLTVPKVLIKSCELIKSIPWPQGDI